METMREGVKDAIRGYLQLRFHEKLDAACEHACEIADLVFLALGISEEEQDRPHEVPMPRVLPIVEFGGKRYFMDERLGEYRNVENPHEIMKIRKVE